VIGNPPYDVLEKERGVEDWPHQDLLYYLRSYAKYAPCLGGKLNLYRPFIIAALCVVKAHGYYGQIIPMSFMGDVSLANTRRHVMSLSRLLSIIAFPQKDDERRRIFREAKLSTCVPIISRQHQNEDFRFVVRTYPWNSFDDRFLESSQTVDDLTTIDPDYIPIPTCSQEEIDLAVRLHKNSIRLRDVADINRGEINQTIYRKFISSNPSHRPLLKGVEIRMFGFNKSLSQGEREFFDEASYERRHHPMEPIKRRIATQRITGVDELRRLVCAVSENRAYFAHSNSIVPHQEKEMLFIAGLLNSTLLNWRFSLTSTNNNVGTNELEMLPYPKTVGASQMRIISSLVQSLQRMEAASTKMIVQSEEYKQLDNEIYSLYEISSDEGRIIERATWMVTSSGS
jgi:hypothetical protein